MKSNKLKILSIQDLLKFIDEYYNKDCNLVCKVVENTLNVFILRFGDDNETKEQFMKKVYEHYKFISELPNNSELPLFLINNQTINREFKIKDLV